MLTIEASIYDGDVHCESVAVLLYEQQILLPGMTGLSSSGLDAAPLQMAACSFSSATKKRMGGTTAISVPCPLFPPPQSVLLQICLVELNFGQLHPPVLSNIPPLEYVLGEETPFTYLNLPPAGFI